MYTLLMVLLHVLCNIKFILLSDVICPSPPVIEGGYLITPEYDLYYYTLTVEYACKGSYSVMEGDPVTTCAINGNWTHIPRCYSMHF